MKNIICSLVLGLCFVSAHAQDNRIRYILPDSVEVKINLKLSKNIDNHKRIKYLFYLSRNTVGVFNLALVSYKDDDAFQFKSWMDTTNRYVLINNSYYPVLLDYDFIFSTPDKEVGVYGSRDGNIRKLNLLTHGYSISFKPDGSILSESNW